MNKIITILIGLCVAVSLMDAQYVEKWHSPARVKDYVGCENTDADNAKEVVFPVRFAYDQCAIMVIDGVSGVVEWTLSPPWYSIYGYSTSWDYTLSPRLIDVNNDGRYEILFYGQPTQADSARWYLYGHAGGKIEEGKPQGSVYQEIFLGQNYPNPATSMTTIDYSLSQKGKVEIKVYNAVGQLVRTLSEGEKEPGTYNIIWDGRDDNGTKLPAGSYFYQLEIDGNKETKKMVLVK
jgi:hypothetical protein